jgi:tripartite-type tricarboxylate transporter receptor subunit TctC
MAAHVKIAATLGRASFLVVLAAVGAAAALQPAASGAAWPERNVTMIVPFGPGGTTDVIGRILCEFLQKKFNTPFVVENRPGAGGNVGLTAGAKAAADGYTLTMVSVSTQAINPFLYQNLTYDAVKDFDPIALIVENANILVVRKDLPVKTTGELVELMKKKPGELTFGSAGIGTSQHLAGELLKSLTGTNAVHVPFRGSGEIMQNLIGGHIDFAFDNLPATTGPMKAGEIRAIAISSPQRYPELPDVPALAETYPGFSAGSWLGLVAPRGTPRPIIDQLSEQVRLFLDDPNVAARLKELRAMPTYRTPEGYREYVTQERDKWSKVVKASGAKVE